MDKKEMLKAEFNYLLTFAKQADLDEEVCRDQFRALWTAYCFHANMDADTKLYDRDLLKLWHTLHEGEVFATTCDWSDYVEFDHFMGRLLF